MQTTPYTPSNDATPDNETADAVNPQVAAPAPRPPDRDPPTDDGEDEPWKEPEAEFLPPRSRSRLLRPVTVLLFAALTASGGFVGGVLMEKHQLPSTASGASVRAGGAATTSARGTATGAGGSAVVGQVSTVNGSTLYVTDSSGNTIKVTTSAASQITKTATASVNSVHPGDTVVIQGPASANGTITATAVRDSGSGGNAGPPFSAGGRSGSTSPTATGRGAATNTNSLFGG